MIGTLKIGEGCTGTANGPNTAAGIFEFDQGTVNVTSVYPPF